MEGGAEGVEGEVPSSSGTGQKEGAALEVSLAAWVGLKWVIDSESKLPKSQGQKCLP